MTYTIEGNTGTWEVVCGLEVHAQVTSNAKLFSGAATNFGAEPNTQVSPVDAGPGSSRGACEADGIALCAASLKIACKGLKLGSLRILLENTAGQGDCIGHRFEHLDAIMRACPKLPLAVCLDTAHAFTAGYDIREADGLEALIQRVQQTVGVKNVRAIHFNDSRAVYNSRVDRHWHIGEGHIGADALRRVAQHPKLKHAAFILETPYDDPRADLKNLERLRSFVC
jgi:deoxyribonuclease-4